MLKSKTRASRRTLGSELGRNKAKACSDRAFEAFAQARGKDPEGIRGSGRVWVRYHDYGKHSVV